jgi:hypothetical protein
VFFILDGCPFVGIVRWRFDGIDHWPLLRKFCVKSNKRSLCFGDVLFCVNGLDWASVNAQVAVNAFLWVDDQKVRAFVKTINRAHIDAICIFATNAAFCYDIRHGVSVSG